MEINGEKIGAPEMLAMVGDACKSNFTVPLGSFADWANAVRDAWQGAVFDGPLRLDLAWHTADHAAQVNQRLRLALDAWDGILYRDQRVQVRELATKTYQDSPARLEVTVTPLPPVLP